MHLVINGKAQTFESSLNVVQLVEQLGMKSDRVAVELNREIVPRAQWGQTSLNDGDRLEIVHFVGGGKAATDLSPACTRSRDRSRWDRGTSAR